MRYTIYSIIFGFLVFFATTQTSAYIAQETIHGEHIESYIVELTIQKDGKVAVREEIMYDFFDLPDRHGIFREIPYVKENMDGRRWKLDFDNWKVEDGNGNQYKYEKSTDGDMIRLKIGDADKVISGIHTYVISYTISGAITYFSDHDELYWNAIGIDWDVPIAQIEVMIKVPQGGNRQQYRFVCYTGYSGSTESDCMVSQEGTGASIQSNRILQAGEGFTIVAGFPIDLVAHLEPEPVVPFSETLLGKTVALFGLLFAVWWYLIYSFVIVIKWYFYGRDPYIGPSVTAYFEAPTLKSGRHLTPAETGTLLDEVAHERDVFATLLDLARRGYLQIIETANKDITLEKRGDHTDKQLLGFEKELLMGLFKGKKTIRVKDENLHTLVEKTKQHIYAQLVRESYFKTDPSKTRNFYQLMTVLALFTLNVPVVFSAFLFGRAMPKKTFEGALAGNKVKGLLNFLKSQERRFDFVSKRSVDYQLSPQFLFEQFLPYAAALGVEKQWIERFSDYKLTSPNWYQAHDAAFTTRSFSHSLQSGMSSFRSSATSTSSSSGFSSGFSGGSSGGGGGGGGGGSW